MRIMTRPTVVFIQDFVVTSPQHEWNGPKKISNSISAKWKTSVIASLPQLCLPSHSFNNTIEEWEKIHIMMPHLHWSDWSVWLWYRRWHIACHPQTLWILETTFLPRQSTAWPCLWSPQAALPSLWNTCLSRCGRLLCYCRSWCVSSH